MNKEKHPGRPGLEDRSGDDQAIEEAARFVQKMGMITPAVLFGEALKPLSWVGSQAVHFLAPYAGAIFGLDRVDRYGFLLEDRQNVERFLGRLEDLAREEDEEKAKAKKESQESKGGW